MTCALGAQGQGLGRAGWEGKMRGILQTCRRRKLPGAYCALGKPSVVTVTSRHRHAGKERAGDGLAPHHRSLTGEGRWLPQRLWERKQTSAPAEGGSGARRRGSGPGGGPASSAPPAHPPAAPPARTCSHLDPSRSDPPRGLHWVGGGPHAGAGRPSHATPTSDPRYNMDEPRGHDAECKEPVAECHAA